MDQKEPEALKVLSHELGGSRRQRLWRQVEEFDQKQRSIDVKENDMM